MFLQHRPASVFHIAALAGVRPSIEDPARYSAVNIDGLINVLDAARESDCRNVVFASSSSVYGNNMKVPFAETDPVDEPISPYAATKRAGELICHSYAHLFGLRIAALRFFTVFGPSQRPDLAIMKFMRLIAAGEEVPMYGDGSTSRDYTYIDDIIHGVLASEKAISERARKDEPSPVGSASGSIGAFRIWNLGGSHPHTLAEMIDTIAHVVGKPARIKPLLMQAGDVERTWADLERSKAELGFEPRTSFNDGVRKQWAWLKTVSTLR
jgi:UDP-glucuronate 4-epimerase